MSGQRGAGGCPDTAAMSRLARGEDAALNEIIERWTPRVGAFLERLVGDRQEAEDLLQETFVAVYRARARYRPVAPFSTWIFGIAMNIARHKLRWRRRHPEWFRVDAAGPGARDDADAGDREPASPGKDAPATPAEKLLADETASAVRAAVLGLPRELREVLILSVYEEMPQAAIAQVTGLTRKAVESRLSRARALLRRRLARWLRG